MTWRSYSATGRMPTAWCEPKKPASPQPSSPASVNNTSSTYILVTPSSRRNTVVMRKGLSSLCWFLPTPRRAGSPCAFNYLHDSSHHLPFPVRPQPVWGDRGKPASSYPLVLIAKNVLVYKTNIGHLQGNAGRSTLQNYRASYATTSSNPDVNNDVLRPLVIPPLAMVKPTVDISWSSPWEISTKSFLAGVLLMILSLVVWWFVFQRLIATRDKLLTSNRAAARVAPAGRRVGRMVRVRLPSVREGLEARGFRDTGRQHPRTWPPRSAAHTLRGAAQRATAGEASLKRCEAVTR